MTSKHADIAWTAGDDWQINATLFDENGNPFLLTGATVMWSLLNAQAQRELADSDVTVTVTDAALGKCSIHVPASKTSSLREGVYSDTIRILTGGITSTLSRGLIHVTANPWAVVDAVMMPQPGMTLLRVV